VIAFYFLIGIRASSESTSRGRSGDPHIIKGATKLRERGGDLRRDAGITTSQAKQPQRLRCLAQRLRDTAVDDRQPVMSRMIMRARWRCTACSSRSVSRAARRLSSAAIIVPA